MQLAALASTHQLPGQPNQIGILLPLVWSGRKKMQARCTFPWHNSPTNSLSKAAGLHKQPSTRRRRVLAKHEKMHKDEG
jgi:hypothetical protein